MRCRTIVLHIARKDRPGLCNYYNVISLIPKRDVFVLQAYHQSHVQNESRCLNLHITPSLIDLHWLPVEYRIIYKILLLVYKAINGLSPSYISNLFSFCSSSYSLRSCLNKLLQVPRSKLKSYGDQRFSILQDLDYGTAFPHL